MKKTYLVSKDQYSGQVVIECEVVMTKVNVYQPTADELEANKYLYRELPKQIEVQPRYHVSAYYHYEDEFNRAHNCLMYEIGRTKEEGNELFKQAMALTR